ncbi:MAG: F0F1 ATP synthase subunit C [Myxococcales bacterium FL481]|nr:MAG: F0F1 ATP synthase subunit C [Myxococcales bacterium FL481]
MNEETLISVVSIVVAGATVAVGTIAPALAEGKAVAAALDAIARQPEAAPLTTRTLFVGIAMVESTAIYCLVVALILLFANPMLG